MIGGNWPVIAQEDLPTRAIRSAFRWGGCSRINCFLNSRLALLREGGRCGLIIPSGIYSDSWSSPLRGLLLDHCRWEWLFGIENRDKVFPIDSRFKFNPVIVEKGGTTEAIRTAFMRRSLDDWERAEDLAISYSQAHIVQFSPRNRAILEVQSSPGLGTP